MRPAFRFDKRLLPRAEAELVVVSDAHFALASAPGGSEFASRSLQTPRLLAALDAAAALEAETCVHLGDLTQDPPESPLFAKARRAASEAFEVRGLAPVWVPGNHDVGDKPDPLMAARPVDLESIHSFESFHGPANRVFERGGVRWISLNSQILGTGWPEDRAQRLWLERELSENRGRRHALLLHLPLFLHDPGEPSTGHYDNLPLEPRRWLLELCRAHGVEGVFSGHIHHRSIRRLESTTLSTCASPAFSRPGFGEVYAGEAPPERGRDDRPKLGIHLLRVRDQGIDNHFVRTGGATASGELAPPGAVPLLTPFSRDLRDPRLGVTVAHPLWSRGSIPWEWPYAIPADCPNDYPLLLLKELAPAAARVPVAEWSAPCRRERLELLRESGTRIETVHLWSAETRERPCEGPDLIEVQIPGRIPASRDLMEIRRWAENSGAPLRLSPVDPRHEVPGKQHHRFRLAWLASEIPALEAAFRAAGWWPQSLLFLADDMEKVPVDLPARPDFLHRLEPGGGIAAIRHLQTVQRRAGSLLHIGPYRDLDRTMDRTEGLLDTCNNPRPVFQALRHAHAWLASGCAAGPVCACAPGPVLDLRLGCLRMSAPEEGLYLPVPSDCLQSP